MAKTRKDFETPDYVIDFMGRLAKGGKLNVLHVSELTGEDDYYYSEQELKAIATEIIIKRAEKGFKDLDIWEYCHTYTFAKNLNVDELEFLVIELCNRVGLKVPE